MKKKKSTADLMESLTQSHDLQLFMDENESDFQREDITDYLQALLKEKHLNISEIAIGSPNAMNFFRELLMKAARDFGFKSDGKPLVVEAAST